MPREVATKAIDRAISSIERGGALDLAFFGGEPLIEAELILDLIQHVRRRAADHDVEIAFSMTTNGTFDSPAAWSVVMQADMRLTLSHDGLPDVHDRHRVAIDGHGSSQRVLNTMGRLGELGKEFRVVMVVQPGTADSLAAGLEFLYEHGVRQFDPSLNLWTVWTRADGERLKSSIAEAADFWVARLPECSVSWFDEKVARISSIPITETARCGFGFGEIAVTPAGNLYPCERLVGADEPTNAMRLPGNVFDGDDFLSIRNEAIHSPDECSPCMIKSQCSTMRCRCSNYVRTNDVNRPDGLLCLLDQACYRETVRVMESRMVVNT
jgi:uncharacterized protein